MKAACDAVSYKEALRTCLEYGPINILSYFILKMVNLWNRIEQE